MTRDCRCPGLEIYANNAFRILGLPADATQAQVLYAGQTLLRKVKIGDSPKTEWELKGLGPLVRTEQNIRYAMGQLRDPRMRLRERFFWFQGVSARTIELLFGASTYDVERFANSWTNTERPLDPHDRAVLLHIAVLLSDVETMQPKRWESAHLAWETAVNSEETWTMQSKAEITAGFEPRARPEEIQELRERAWEFILEPLVKLGRDAVARDDWSAANRVLGMLRSDHIPPKISVSLEAEILGPLEDALESARKEVHNELWQSINRDNDHSESNRAACDQAYECYRTQVVPLLERIVCAAGNSSEPARNGKETVGCLLRQIAIGYTWGNAFRRSKDLLEEALAVVQEGPAAVLIEATLAEIRPGAEQEQLQDRIILLARAKVFHAAQRKKWIKRAIWGIVAAVVLYAVLTDNSPRRSEPPPKTVTRSPESPNPSSRVETNIAANRLRPQIENGRAQIRLLESELQTIASRLDMYIRGIAVSKQSIDEYEKLAQSGVPFSESDFKNEIEKYKRLVKKHNQELQTYEKKYAEYDNLLNEDKKMVAEYNALIRRQ